jgi:hypothetical protein
VDVSILPMDRCTMDGWVGGCMYTAHGWMYYGWMHVTWMNGCMDACRVYVWIHGWMYVLFYGCMEDVSYAYGSIDGCMLLACM